MNPEISYDSDMESDGRTYAASLQSEDMMDTDDYNSHYNSVDAHLWGYLQPCNPAKTRIDFWRLQACVTFGRGTSNQIVFPGARISMNHCTITWDGTDSESGVVVRDLSTNGTFVNGQRVGNRRTRILKDGNEIAFGSSVPQLEDDGEHDYRFFYRHVASKARTRGLYAEYDLGDLIGRGAFGVVHRALHRESGKWYAVKMIDMTKLPEHDGKPAHDKVVREISIMEGLKHRNICRIYETFFLEGDNNINLILELVKNGDLWEHIMRTPDGLSEHHTKDITYQICDAMQYVHAQGITHRDLKPENILLAGDENFPTVKVADFGLSKVVDRMTMLRSFCGTPVYLAPEVASSNVSRKGYDNRVDSFSVGAIVYLCLTKREPFVVPPKNAKADAATRVKTRKRNLSALNSKDLSANVSNFIYSLLEDNPRRRPSMSEALAHPWLAEYEPYHGFGAVSGEEEESSESETDDDDTLHASEEYTKTMTRSMTKARTQSGKGKGRATGKVLYLAPLVEEESSGASFDADTDMAPATPTRKSKSREVPTPTTEVRRSLRPNKGVRKL